jgi:hypothetical protein
MFAKKGRVSSRYGPLRKSSAHVGEDRVVLARRGDDEYC